MVLIATCIPVCRVRTAIATTELTRTREEIPYTIALRERLLLLLLLLLLLVRLLLQLYLQLFSRVRMSVV